MTEVVRLKITPTVAAFVRPGVPADKKLSGIQRASQLEPHDRLTLLFCLLKDADTVVKEAAVSAFSALPVDILQSYIQAADAHPALLNEIAKIHCANEEVVAVLSRSSVISGHTRDFLKQQQPVAAPVPTEEVASNGRAEEPDADALLPDEPVPDCDLPFEAGELTDGESVEADDIAVEEVDVEDEQYLSKYKVAMIMGIGEKIKMALTGDKEWRAILVKDTNKLVSGSVVKNPRITDGEILTLLKVGVQNDEIIRLICANKEWIKNYTIRKALVTCPKTPLPNALRYLATLNEKDIAGFAKSRNISSVISTQAKRIILSKKR